MCTVASHADGADADTAQQLAECMPSGPSSCLLDRDMTTVLASVQVSEAQAVGVQLNIVREDR